MAHKKGQGSSRNGRDSCCQYRGVKIYGGQTVLAGNILVRQVGTKIHPGTNVGRGSDFTLWSKIDGIVKYERVGKDKVRASVYEKGDVRLSPPVPVVAKPKAPKTAKPAAAAAAS